MKEAKAILHNLCGRDTRFCLTGEREWTIWAGDKADSICRAVLDSQPVLTGTEGWEKLPALGEVQHVFTLRLTRWSLRILSERVKNKGQFS